MMPPEVDNNKPDTTMGERRVSVGTRYPLEKVKLLEVLQVRRGDTHFSDTVSAALDDFLVNHGLIERAA